MINFRENMHEMQYVYLSFFFLHFYRSMELLSPVDVMKYPLERLIVNDEDLWEPLGEDNINLMDESSLNPI